MKNIQSANQDYDLWLLLFQVRNAIFKARERELSQYGLRPGRAGVLHFMHVTGNKGGPADISRWLLREHHSVSELVDRMAKEGLVKKSKDVINKKNRIRVEMTEKGRQAYYLSIKRNVIHEVMSCLSEEERHQLGSCLKKLRSKAVKVLGMEHEPLFP